jgi:hypothetical protein
VVKLFEEGDVVELGFVVLGGGVVGFLVDDDAVYAGAADEEFEEKFFVPAEGGHVGRPCSGLGLRWTSKGVPGPSQELVHWVET